MEASESRRTGGFWPSCRAAPPIISGSWIWNAEPRVASHFEGQQLPRLDSGRRARCFQARLRWRRESLWWSAVGEGGSEERLTADSPEDKRPYSVSPDGRLLAYASRDDVLFLELSGALRFIPF